MYLFSLNHHHKTKPLPNSYLNTIQTVCPYIIRYITTAIITNKKKRPSLKELVQIIQHESPTYRDPIVEFVESLYVDFDFTSARMKLMECKMVCVYYRYWQQSGGGRGGGGCFRWGGGVGGSDLFCYQFLLEQTYVTLQLQ